MHEHKSCDHDVKYCAHCDVAYCEKCNTEWKKPVDFMQALNNRIGKLPLNEPKWHAPVTVPQSQFGGANPPFTEMARLAQCTHE